MHEPCPLCGASARSFHRSGGRDFVRCGECLLTFVPTIHHLSADAQRRRYVSHDNDPEDPRYRAFLDRLLAPLAELLPAGARGLDFGCGPGPTASKMMAERGFPCRDYDPFFASDEEALSRRYDFVICTEVLEHLVEPAETLERIDALLEPGGMLGVMTGVLEDDDAFPGWWYHGDPTHVAFYRPETLEWIGRRRGWRLERVSRDVALFRKGDGRPG